MPTRQEKAEDLTNHFNGLLSGTMTLDEEAEYVGNAADYQEFLNGMPSTASSVDTYVDGELTSVRSLTQADVDVIVWTASQTPSETSWSSRNTALKNKVDADYLSVAPAPSTPGTSETLRR